MIRSSDAASFLLLALAACGTTVSTDGGTDVASTDAPDTFDVVEHVAPETGVDVVDAFDVPPEISLPDAAPDVEAAVCTPPTTPPPLGRSCMGGGVDPELCREVFYCGSTFTMGTRWGSEIDETNGRMDVSQIDPCEFHPMRVHDGYVDAYEVTVGRFRQWVNAGMPSPAVGSHFFNGWTWYMYYAQSVSGASTSMDSSFPVPGAVTGPSQCTWTATLGANERLPVNCVTPPTAAAFCWWEGKHLATEAAWEYVARNRGVNEQPWGTELVTVASPCLRGDVGAFTGVCPSEPLPQAVGTHLMGDSLDPPGVHDLFGGVEEWVLGEAYQYWAVTRTSRDIAPPGCSVPGYDDGHPPPPPVEMAASALAMARGMSWMGVSWLDSALMYSASREEPGGQYIPSPRTGFRCMRWDPEPRD